MSENTSKKSSFSSVRPELVGKRFLYVPCEGQYSNNNNSSNNNVAVAAACTSRKTAAPEKKLKLSRIADWNWMGGVIRCASSAKDSDRDLQVGLFSAHLLNTAS